MFAHMWSRMHALYSRSYFLFQIEDKKPSLLHEYSIVIQQYFQNRVQNWMSTVGKIVFNVKGHWLRYEFAPGWGQIHAHCLLIVDNIDVQTLSFHVSEQIQDDLQEFRASVIQGWVERDLCMTTGVPRTTDHKLNFYPIYNSMKNHPASKRLQDVSDLHEDAADILSTVQNHFCTHYCLKDRKRL